MPPLSEPLWVLAGAWLLVALYLAAEALRHRRVLRRIPIRIHVNGTRGKTSVVRLIAAGLRAGGRRVCAKTSGTLAAVTDPEGREFPVFRLSQANVIEQLRVIQRVARFRPEAIVVECMALQPQYQSLTELQMVRSTHGVITNLRPDHLDVMGPSEADVARAIAGSTPLRAPLFTAARRHLDVLEAAAADRGAWLRRVGEPEAAAVPESTLARFRYEEHAENVALALAVCEELGVEREAALEGMLGLAPEPGATRVFHLSFHGREIVFVHAFAANDPESTGSIWERMVTRFGEGRRRVAVVNCRADRPDRSRQIAAAAAEWSPADDFVVMGSGTFLFAREATRRGIAPERLAMEEGASSEEVVETILERSGPRSLVVGMANIHGGGFEVARFFSNRAREARSP